MPNRGYKIPADIKNLIYLHALKEKNKPRAEVAAELQVIIKNKGVPVPQEDTLMRMISAARNKEANPLDNPWHLGTLKDYPLPVEAIPYILQVQQSITLVRSMTIRHALWVSRLYTSVKKIELLQALAWYYSLYERICELSNTTPADTTKFDKQLLKIKSLKDIDKLFEGIYTLANYENEKKAYEEVSNGVQFMGISVPIDHYVIHKDKILSPIKIEDKGGYVVIPFVSQETLLDALKKEKLIKEIKKLDNDITVIRLKRTISQAFENKEFNEWLYYLIKEGENERSYSPKVKE